MQLSWSRPPTWAGAEKAELDFSGIERGRLSERSAREAGGAGGTGWSGGRLSERPTREDGGGRLSERLAREAVGEGHRLDASQSEVEGERSERRVGDGGALLQGVGGEDAGGLSGLVEVDHDAEGAVGSLVGVEHASGGDEIAEAPGDEGAYGELVAGRRGEGGVAPV